MLHSVSQQAEEMAKALGYGWGSSHCGDAIRSKWHATAFYDPVRVPVSLLATDNFGVSVFCRPPQRFAWSSGLGGYVDEKLTPGVRVGDILLILTRDPDGHRFLWVGYVTYVNDVAENFAFTLLSAQRP